LSYGGKLFFSKDLWQLPPVVLLFRAVSKYYADIIQFLIN